MEEAIKKELESGRLVDMLHSHITNPENVGIMIKVQRIFLVMIGLNLEDHMSKLMTIEALKGLCISGSGADEIELKHCSTVLTTWVIT